MKGTMGNPKLEGEVLSLMSLVTREVRRSKLVPPP